VDTYTKLVWHVPEINGIYMCCNLRRIAWTYGVTVEDGFQKTHTPVVVDGEYYNSRQESRVRFVQKAVEVGMSDRP